MNIKKHHNDFVGSIKETIIAIKENPFGDIMMHWWGFKMFIINILILILAVVMIILFPITYVVAIGSRIIQEKFK